MHHPHKARTGLTRMWYAAGYSLQGLQAAWQQAAFRQECGLALLGTPLAFYIGQHWVETALLIACLILLLVAELLNSGIEAAIDRIGPELHPLSKQAKDLGSAAVLLSLLLCIGVWLAALVQHFKLL